MCKQHNGYGNYETWNVTLWLHNEHDSYLQWTARAEEIKEEAGEESQDSIWTEEEYVKFTLADEIEKSVKGDNPLVDDASMFVDLLNAALSSVNWDEVANSFIEE